MDFGLQAISLLGAGLILGAFVALQLRWWSSHSAPYLWLNFVGSALLTVVAISDRRYGFILLETTWALVSLVSILRPGSAPRQA